MKTVETYEQKLLKEGTITIEGADLKTRVSIFESILANLKIATDKVIATINSNKCTITLL